MTTNYLSTLALIATFFISGHSFAEDNKTKSNNVKTTTSAKQPRDAASGLPTGKRQHKPVNVTKPVDKSSPRLSKSPNGFSTRAASGLPTGKRQHKPISMTKELDKSSPQLARSAYRKCPDGTMINPGEKCPEKAVRAGYRLCPDGNTMVSHGQKCPEKATRSIQRK